MIRTGKLILAGVAVAFAALTSGCGSDVAEEAEPSGRAGTGFFGLGETRAETTPPTTSPRRTTAPTPTTTTTTKPNPQAGSGFDPCSVTWADFPPAVRPTDPAATGVKTGVQPQIDAICRFDNSTGAAVGQVEPAGPGAFALRVIWSTKLNPAKVGEGTPKSWNGKAGAIKAYSGAEGKGCLAQVGAYGGLVGIQTINNRFSEIDPCAVADAVLTAITAKAP